jgi:hypothetical protein
MITETPAGLADPAMALILYQNCGIGCRIPNLYFDALAKLSDRDVPFDRECYRLENGMLTAGSYPGAPPPDPAMPRNPYCANRDIPGSSGERAKT